MPVRVLDDRIEPKSNGRSSTLYRFLWSWTSFVSFQHLFFIMGFKKGCFLGTTSTRIVLRRVNAKASAVRVTTVATAYGLIIHFCTISSIVNWKIELCRPIRKVLSTTLQLSDEPKNRAYFYDTASIVEIPTLQHSTEARIIAFRPRTLLFRVCNEPDRVGRVLEVRCFSKRQY